MPSITTENIGDNVVTSAKLARSLDIPTAAITALTATAATVTTLTLGATALTATATELNQLAGRSGVCCFFDVTATATEVKSGTKVVVPAVASKQFYPTFAAMQATGAVTTATGIRLQESTTAGVVLGHIAADMTSLAWVGPTGGTPTITKLNTALTVSEGIVIVDYTLNTLTVTTAIRAIVAGYYI